MILKYSQKELEVGVICRIRIGFIIINLLSIVFQRRAKRLRACACILRLRLRRPMQKHTVGYRHTHLHRLALCIFSRLYKTTQTADNFANIGVSWSFSQFWYSAIRSRQGLYNTVITAFKIARYFITGLLHISNCILQ